MTDSKEEKRVTNLAARMKESRSTALLGFST